MTAFNVPSIERSIQNKDAKAASPIKQRVLQQGQEKQNSENRRSSGKKDGALGLEPIVQKEYGCATAGLIARVCRTFSYSEVVLLE